MEYLSVAQVAEKWGISMQRVRVLCKADRIPGVERVGKNYLIPQNVRKPRDSRVKTGKYKKQESICENQQHLLLQSPEMEVMKYCFEKSPDLFCLYDLNSYEILYANQMTRMLLGEERDKKKICSFFCSREDVCVDDGLQKAEHTREVLYLQGAQKYFSVYKQVLEINGRQTGQLCGADVTDSVSENVKVREERERFEEMYSVLPAGFLIFQKENSHLTICHANSHAVHLLGMDAKTLRNADVEKQLTGIHPREYPELLGTLRNIFLSQDPVTERFRSWDEKSKRYRWFQMVLQAGKHYGAAAYAYAVITDVTREVQLISELKESKEMLEQAESNALIHYMDYDVRTQIAVLGKQTQRAYGLDSNILPYYPDSVCRPDILYPMDYEMFRDNFVQVVSERIPDLYFNVRVMDRSKNHYGWRRMHLVSIYDENRNLMKITGTSIDVDYYKQLEERYMQALIQNGIWIWEYDPQQHKSILCSAFDELGLFDPEKLLKHEAVHPDHLKRAEAAEKEMAAGVLHQQLELPVKVRKKEEYVWVRIVITGLFEYDGVTIQKYICTVKDITKERENNYVG